MWILYIWQIARPRLFSLAKCERLGRVADSVDAGEDIDFTCVTPVHRRCVRRGLA